MLVDHFGREHRDLRISLTDRCSLRCTYCMPAEGVPWLRSPDLMTTTELVRIAAVAVAEGITEVRLTGGEPLLRPDVVEIVAALTALSGPSGSPELSLTTNALRLPALATPLADAGLSRVNISLDTSQCVDFSVINGRNVAELQKYINKNCAKEPNITEHEIEYIGAPQIYPEKTLESTLKCGERFSFDSQASNETKVQASKWPWLVAFFYWPGNEFMCSGSLISSRHVLSGENG